MLVITRGKHLTSDNKSKALAFPIHRSDTGVLSEREALKALKDMVGGMATPGIWRVDIYTVYIMCIYIYING